MDARQMMIRDATATHRRLVADLLDRLDEQQLETPSLCAAWTTRQVAGHLVVAVDVAMGGFLLELARQRGSADRTSSVLAVRVARRPVPELSAVLRDKADFHLSLPFIGAVGQLADTAIHLRDMARPLGLPDDVPPPSWRTVLDFLMTRPAQVGHVPRGLPKGLRFVATDQDWAHGEGPEVRGPSEALGMALAGRLVAVDDLTGDGVATVRRRLTAR